MIEFKANSFQMFSADNSDVIYETSDIGDMVVETEVDSYSMSQEVLKLNYEATFEAEMVDCTPLMTYTTDLNDRPLYVEFRIPIMVQSRWHKKNRLNKKWLKRYGMKKDNVLVRCDVESISPKTNCDPYYSTVFMESSITFGNMQYKFRPDQLRKNLKMTTCCD